MSKVDEAMGSLVLQLEPVEVLRNLQQKYRDRLSELYVLDSVSSTNDYVMAQASACDECCIVCVADRQTAGKGRNGRVWQSPAGASAYISLGRSFSPDAVGRLSQLSLYCGVALAEWLQSLGLQPQLKWPNDILVNGQKLAGILVETRFKGDVPFVVMGLGLNIDVPVSLMQAVDQPWTDLASCLPGDKVYANRNRLVSQLIEVLLRATDEFDVNNTLWFKEMWQRYDILTGREVEVMSASGAHSATVLGLADDCALQVDVNGEIQSVYAADIKLKIK